MKSIVIWLLAVVFTLGVSCKKESESKPEEVLKRKELIVHTESCKRSQAQGNGCSGSCMPPPEDEGDF